MEQNAELLMEIYKNAELERAVLGRLIRNSEDAAFRSLLADQFTVYHSIMQEAHDALNRHGILAQEYGPLEKKPIFASIALHLKIDKTSSHMAEMLVRGNVTGLIETTRTLHEAESQENHIEEAVLQLGERLKSAQQKHMEQLLAFV